MFNAPTSITNFKLFLTFALIFQIDIFMMTSHVPQKVIILGGGIHGASLAYYLTKNYNSPERTDVVPIVIERIQVAGNSLTLLHIFLCYRKLVLILK